MTEGNAAARDTNNLKNSIDNLTFIPTAGSGDTPAGRIVSISPFRCRPWALHDRMEDYVTEESCKEEIVSFAHHGQLAPALGRPLSGDPDHDVEIIYGARRLFVARHLGVALQVELRSLSDREAIVAMDIENRHRKDLSPYERGRSYLQWLRMKYFNSQDDIAQALKISPSQVSRLLKLAQLPSVVVAAFSSPLDIREGWGLDLYKAWHDVRMRPIIAQRARALSERSVLIGPHEVYERLLAPVTTTVKPTRRSPDVVIRNPMGKPVLQIRQQRNTIALVLHATATSPASLERIRQSLVSLLEAPQRSPPQSGADSADSQRYSSV